MNDKSYSFETIGTVHSCFKEKFGIPRQPGLVNSATGTIKLIPPYNHKDSIRGLEDFSHIWVLFIFHGIKQKLWKPTVRPPRLGGNERLGVFATRSTHRPNAIGMSVVKLDEIIANDKEVILKISSIDLLDGTPVVDIKPYIPYSDSRLDAIGGYANDAPSTSISVDFSAKAKQMLNTLAAEEKLELETLIIETLQLDPRPAYYKSAPNKQTSVHSSSLHQNNSSNVNKEFGMRLKNWNIKWRQDNERALVTEIQ